MGTEPLTANQTIAFNLRRARVGRGWTQERACQEIEPHLGELWSKAVLSLAERSVAGTRIRQFSADEIQAFARTFGVPVWYFFLMPPDQRAGESGGEAGLGPLVGSDSEMLLDALKDVRAAPGGDLALSAALEAVAAAVLHSLSHEPSGVLESVAHRLIELGEAYSKVAQTLR